MQSYCPPLAAHHTNKTSPTKPQSTSYAPSALAEHERRKINEYEKTVNNHANRDQRDQLAHQIRVVSKVGTMSLC